MRRNPGWQYPRRIAIRDGDLLRATWEDDRREMTYRELLDTAGIDTILVSLRPLQLAHSGAVVEDGPPDRCLFDTEIATLVPYRSRKPRNGSTM